MGLVWPTCVVWSTKPLVYISCIQAQRCAVRLRNSSICCCHCYGYACVGQTTAMSQLFSRRQNKCSRYCTVVASFDTRLNNVIVTTVQTFYITQGHHRHQTVPRCCSCGVIWVYALLESPLPGQLRANMTSFTKPKVRNIYHCRQSRTEPRNRFTEENNFISLLFFLSKVLLAGIFGTKACYFNNI